MPWPAGWTTRQALGIGGRARLFCTLAGDPVSDDYVRGLLRRLAAKVGIGHRVHPHGLLHTFATELEAARNASHRDQQAARPLQRRRHEPLPRSPDQPPGRPGGASRRAARAGRPQVTCAGSRMVKSADYSCRVPFDAPLWKGRSAWTTPRFPRRLPVLLHRVGVPRPKVADSRQRRCPVLDISELGRPVPRGEPPPGFRPDPDHADGCDEQ